MNNIIEINNLIKHFGNIKAVDDISFNVEEGSLFAFLGINGAGKSTTINILCSIMQKDGGSVIIDGLNLDDKKNIDKIKKTIGIVFQQGVLDSRLSVKDNLEIRASYYGLFGKELADRINNITKLLNLEDLLKRTYDTLSGGQKRRVDIARALLNKPKILFLDEPTTGLDPKSRKVVWEVINNLRKNQNTTVFLTTHYMEEASTADKVVIIDNGKIIASDTPNNLKNKYSGDYIKLYSKKDKQIEEFLKNYNYKFSASTYKIKVSNSIEAKKLILKNPYMFNDFEIVKGDMDDVFLNATGKSLEDTFK